MGKLRTAAARKYHKNDSDDNNSSNNSSDEEASLKKSPKKPGPKSTKRKSSRHSNGHEKPTRSSRRFQANDDKSGKKSKNDSHVSVTINDTSSEDEAGQSNGHIEPTRKSRRSQITGDKSGEKSKNSSHVSATSDNTSSEDEALADKQKTANENNKSPKVTKRKADTSTDEKRSIRRPPVKESQKKTQSEKVDRYEVEKILDHKIENNVKYFLIHWKGYGSDVDSWEKSRNISCPALLAQYYEKHPDARMPLKGKLKRKRKEVQLPPLKPLKIDEQLDYDSDWDENEDYEVEKILDVHFQRDNTREFLIRWKGYSSKSDSWEPERNLDCKDLIEKFMAKLDRVKNVTQKELRAVRPITQRFTLMTCDGGRRLSKRNSGRQRAVYYDCDE